MFEMKYSPDEDWIVYVNGKCYCNYLSKEDAETVIDALETGYKIGRENTKGDRHMHEFSVCVEARVSTIITVFAETEEDAEREALVIADTEDLNDWNAEDSYVVDIIREED